MEFTLDIELVRSVLRSEHASAVSDLSQRGALRAVRESLIRQDERLLAAPDAESLACKPGCAWCCYFTVDVRAVEAFSILDFIEQRFTPDQKASVYAEIRANSRKFRALDESDRVTFNNKCPFLVNSECSIYSVRPQSCRNYHATDSAGCQQSFESPEDLDIDPEFAPGVFQVGGAHVEAFSAALTKLGYDTAAYELNSALDAALSEDGARDRFEARQSPFLSLVGDEVFPQYDDLGP